MKSFLGVVLGCLIGVSCFGMPTNKALTNGALITIEKIDVDNFRILLESSSIQYKIALLIRGFLEEKQTAENFQDLMLDIKTVVLNDQMKGLIVGPSIIVDEKKFLESSIVHFEVEFKVPHYDEKSAQLSFEFKVDIEDE